MFTGSIVAIVTPMDEKGNVCRASLKKLIDYHVASGTSAIVSVGTTGESATLNHDEHADVVMMTLDLADGRIPVIAGTGANATAEAISLTQRFNDSGIVGCLTVTPYYNRPSQEGLYQHFKAIAEHTDLPQILYKCAVPYWLRSAPGNGGPSGESKKYYRNQRGNRELNACKPDQRAGFR